MSLTAVRVADISRLPDGSTAKVPALFVNLAAVRVPEISTLPDESMTKVPALFVSLAAVRVPEISKLPERSVIEPVNGCPFTKIPVFVKRIFPEGSTTKEPALFVSIDAVRVPDTSRFPATTLLSTEFCRYEENGRRAIVKLPEISILPDESMVTAPYLTFKPPFRYDIPVTCNVPLIS